MAHHQNSNTRRPVTASHAAFLSSTASAARAGATPEDTEDGEIVDNAPPPADRTVHVVGAGNALPPSQKALKRMRKQQQQLQQQQQQQQASKKSKSQEHPQLTRLDDADSGTRGGNSLIAWLNEIVPAEAAAARRAAVHLPAAPSQSPLPQRPQYEPQNHCEYPQQSPPPASHDERFYAQFEPHYEIRGEAAEPQYEAVSAPLYADSHSAAFAAEAGAHATVERLLTSGQLPTHLQNVPRDQLARILLHLPQFHMSSGAPPLQPPLPPPPPMGTPSMSSHLHSFAAHVLALAHAPPPPPPPLHTESRMSLPHSLHTPTLHHSQSLPQHFQLVAHSHELQHAHSALVSPPPPPSAVYAPEWSIAPVPLGVPSHDSYSNAASPLVQQLPPPPPTLSQPALDPRLNSANPLPPPPLSNSMHHHLQPQPFDHRPAPRIELVQFSTPAPHLSQQQHRSLDQPYAPFTATLSTAADLALPLPPPPPMLHSSSLVSHDTVATSRALVPSVDSTSALHRQASTPRVASSASASASASSRTPFPALRDNTALCAEFFVGFPPTQLRGASAEIAFSSVGALPLPESGLSFHFSAQDIVLRCSDVLLTAECAPPCALRMRSEVWVPCGVGHEFSRPFLKILRREVLAVQPHFRVRTYLSRSTAMSDADVFDYFTERSVGNQMFLTNACINDEYALFLLPCRLLHPDGTGALLGGHSGRRGGSLAPTASMPPEAAAASSVWSALDDGASSAIGRSYAASAGTMSAAAAAAASASASSDGTAAAAMCREVVFEAFVLPLRKLFCESLSAYALPALEAERLQCVLDLDKTLVVSVRADQATVAQRAAAIGTALPFRVNDIELLLIPRPGLCEFLIALASRFDFSFCTMGTREYAAAIFQLMQNAFPEVPWRSCREVVSSDYTRIASNRARGFKELRALFSYAHWPRWRNTTVIVDDTVDVWQPDHMPFIYKISEFVGPTATAPSYGGADAGTVIGGTEAARLPMEAGLHECWRLLRNLHTLFFEEARRVGAAPMPANIVSSAAALAPEALRRVPLLQRCSVADLMLPALHAAAAEVERRR